MNEISQSQQTIQNPSRASLICKYTDSFAVGSKLVILEDEEVVIFLRKEIQYILHGGTYCFTKVAFQKIFVDSQTLNNSCHLFFINKSNKLSVEWGTDAPLQIQDPITKVIVKIVAHGKFDLTINDSKKLLTQIFDIQNMIEDDEYLKDYLFHKLIDKIKNFITNVIIQSQTDILSTCNNINTISGEVESSLYNVVFQYGFFLDKFYILNLHILQDNQFELFQRTLQRNEQMEKFTHSYSSDTVSPSLYFIDNISNCDQVQIGTVNSQQTKGLKNDEIRQITDMITENIAKIQIETTKKDEILNEVQKINNELAKKNPKQSNIQKGFAIIKNILEGVAESIIASDIAYKLGLFQ